MEEKIEIKGIFRRVHIVSLIFLALVIFGIHGFNETGFESWPLVVFSLPGVIGMVFFRNLLNINPCELTVTNKRVYGKAVFAKRVDLPLDKISSVTTCMFNGIGVATSSGVIKFFGCKNRDEVFEAVSTLLIERQNQKGPGEDGTKKVAPQSDADELKKFKELLDMGAITQEEFDAKKKQLLGL